MIMVIQGQTKLFVEDWTRGINSEINVNLKKEELTVSRVFPKLMTPRLTYNILKSVR